MKTAKNLYDQTWKWENLVEAEDLSVRNKQKRTSIGVRKHVARRWKNMAAIQKGLHDGTIRTGEYKVEYRVSGHGKHRKRRKIEKLRFHPNHIYHQVVTMVATPRLEKAMYYYSCGNRTGKGPVYAAKVVSKWIREDPIGTRWVCQDDIRKYYETMEHPIARREVEHYIADKRLVDAFMEPLTAHGDIGAPLGIRNSQLDGNVTLNRLDHWVKEWQHVNYYIRYVDDSAAFFRTKGEAKVYARRKTEWMRRELHLEMKPPKIFPIESCELDFMGYVIHPRGELFWRKSDKVNWLRHRAKVTNPKRIRELDASAKGMLSHGNEHCKRLFEKMTGISLDTAGIKPPEAQRDGRGHKVFNRPKVTASFCVDKPIKVLDWDKDIDSPKYGPGRWLLEIEFMGSEYKMWINSAQIKSFINNLESYGVTKFSSIIRMDNNDGFKSFVFRNEDTGILAIDGIDIEQDTNGDIVYSDTKEKVVFVKRKQKINNINTEDNEEVS